MCINAGSPGICELEERVAEELARERLLSLRVARPVLCNRALALVGVEVLDHHAVDAPQHQRMALLMQLVRGRVPPRVQAALRRFPVHLKRFKHDLVMPERLTRLHLLLGRKARIALLPVLHLLELSCIVNGGHDATCSHQLVRLVCRSPCIRVEIECSDSGATLDSFAQLLDVF